MIAMAAPVPRSSKAGVPNRESSLDQGELALSSVKAHKLFPGRITLYIREVANAFETSDNQIISLIEEGKLHAINIAGGNNKSARNYWRIPVSAFDAYVAQYRSNPEDER